MYSQENKGLMHSVVNSDKEKIDNGKMIKDAINRGLNNFQPDILFENLVNNYSYAEKLYGKTILKQVTGYEPEYLKNNIKIPEFQKILKSRIAEKIKKMVQDGLLNKEGEIEELGLKLASYVLYLEELDKLIPKGELGKFISKTLSFDGIKEDIRNFSNSDRYRDIALRKVFKRAITRSHTEIMKEDLVVFERKKSGERNIVFVLDASGSMRGDKMDSAKKAGIALAYRSIEANDKIGLVVFSSDVKERIEPTNEMITFTEKIVTVRPSKETNIADAIKAAREMLSNKKVTKHIVLLTDALPNIGEKPEENALSEVSICRAEGISISLIGIGLDAPGKKLAKRIVEIGEGRLYLVKEDEKLDRIVLLDYHALA